MAEIKAVLKAAGRRLELVPMLWRFDQLDAEAWREHSLAEAARGSVVVLASSRPHVLSDPLERWIGTLLSRGQGRKLTIVALLGPNEAWTISLQAPRKNSAVASGHTERPPAARRAVGTLEPAGAACAA